MMDAAKFTLATERLPGLSQHPDMPVDLGHPGHCLLLDAALDDTLLEALYAERDADGWAVESLYLGTPLRPLASVGPQLVRVWWGSRVIGELLNRMEREPLGIALFPVPELSWEALCDHCRNWLSVPGANATPLQLRWFNPRWIRALLTALTSVQRQALAGPWQTLAWHGVAGWSSWSPDTMPGDTKLPSAPVFDDALLARLDAERLRDTAVQLALDYHEMLTLTQDGPDGPERYVYDTLTSAHHYGFTQQALQERWLRLAILHGDDFYRRSPEAEALLTDANYLHSDRLAMLETLYQKGTTA